MKNVKYLENKIKKTITIICFTFIAIGANLCFSYANNNTNIYIYNPPPSDVYFIKFIHHSPSYGLSFFETGNCRHWTPHNANNCREGKYYVKNQIIYITWNNGQKETLEIYYKSNGSAYINYKGRTYYENYNGN